MQNNKGFLASMILEIEEKIQQKLKDLKTLINKYDTLNKLEKELLAKSTIRLKRIIEIQLYSNLQTQNNKITNNIITIEEGIYDYFTEKDIEIMKDSIKQLNIPQQLIQTFLQEIDQPVTKRDINISVNQKTIQFMQYKKNGSYYYGYLYNDIRNGRGVSIYESQIFNGYFIDGLCEFGTTIALQNNQIQVDKNFLFQNYSISIDNKYAKIADKWTQFQQESIKQNPQMKNLIQGTIFCVEQQYDNIQKKLNQFQIHQSDIIYYSDGYYSGFIKKDTKNEKIIRHGFGTFCIFCQQTLSIGIWNNNQLVWGLFLQLLTIKRGNKLEYQEYKEIDNISNEAQDYLQFDFELHKEKMRKS